MLRFLLVSSLLALAASQEINLETVPGELCFRNCRNSVPRICYFNLNLEHYHVLGPACGTCGYANATLSDCYNSQCITTDGVQRGVMSINRQIPGPGIHVCQNDLIVVDVTNHMGGTTSTLHWHGFHHRKTPHFDGVPFITQCPIDFATTFRYSYFATEPGTHFYHSHTGHHKVNGHYGGIVVRRDPREDPNSDLYDKDLKNHMIVIADWMFQDGEWYFPGLRDDALNINPTNVLINGKGIIQDETGKAKVNVPLEVFRVTRGLRYRFRLINSGSHICPFVLEIKDHKLEVIASDSFDLQPVTVDEIYSNPGERYDFVVNANQPGDTFLMRLRGVGPCESRKIQQFAILTYKPNSVKLTDIAFPHSTPFPLYGQNFGAIRSLNNPNTTCGDANVDNLCITDLSSYVSSPDITDVEPDYKFCLGFINGDVEVSDVTGPNIYDHFMNLGKRVVRVGQINGITFVHPPFAPLTQPDLVNDDEFCDVNKIPESCNGKKVCPCVHRLKVKLNSIVELIIVDETGVVNTVSHPFHMHGYKLFVMGMGQHPDKSPMTCAHAQEKAGTMPRLSKNKPLKDTISIPSKGFTVFRFKADNPGWWFLHCHYEWHMANGMALVVQVGETDQMVKPPPGFPTCNHYKPKINSDFFTSAPI